MINGLLDMEEYLFIVYDGETPVRWFIDMQEGIEYSLTNNLRFVRLHLFTDGTIKALCL